MTTARETALKLSIAIKDLTDYEDYGKEIFPMILAALEQRDRVIEVLRKALEFYGDESNWETEHVCDSCSGAVGDLFTGVLNEDACFEEMGGKHAREALTAVEKILGE